MGFSEETVQFSVSSHSKIAQFNWECTGRLIRRKKSCYTKIVFRQWFCIFSFTFYMYNQNTMGISCLKIIILCVLIACGIPKVTATHSEYVTHCFSTSTMVTRTRLDVKLYACIEHYLHNSPKSLHLSHVYLEGRTKRTH